MRKASCRLFIALFVLVSAVNLVLVSLPGTALGQALKASSRAPREPEVVYGSQIDEGLVSESALWADPMPDREELMDGGADGLDAKDLPLPSQEADTYRFTFDDWCPSDSDEPLVGIDVSEWNGTVEWDLVKDHVDFVILRIGGSYEGSVTSYKDGQFAHNVRECERLGIPYGIYFYSTAFSAWDAAQEADYVCGLLEGTHPSLPVFIDLEWEKLEDPSSATLLTKIASTFCGRVAAAGWTPGVYSSMSWWDKQLTDRRFDQWAKWVAQCDTDCQIPCNCWQYDHQGTMEGCEGSVDLNYWYPSAS